GGATGDIADAGGRHSRSDGSQGLGTHDTGTHDTGIHDRTGRHPDDVDPAAHPDREPGVVDKVLGRNRRDEQGR
ncbi:MULTISPECIES: hypothetical protein, partial [Dietzia]